MKSEMVEKLKAHLASITQEEFEKEWKEATGKCLTESVEDEEDRGLEILNYCKQYEGTDKYNVAMLAIEFGYALAIKDYAACH
jgi:hypothetical protein